MNEPLHTAPGVTIWRMKLVPSSPDQEAHLAAWLILGPFHPAWTQWTVNLCHLRPMEGVRPAVKHYPEAQYEVLIASVDPGYLLDPEMPLGDGSDGTQAVHVLEPSDVVEQFQGIDDEAAIKTIGGFLGLVAQGALSPDFDFRRHWHELLEPFRQ